MLNIYNIAIFLDKQILNGIVSDLRGFFTIEKITLTDQENTKAIAYELVVSGLSLIFLESNYFHKHLDYEIGLTTKDYNSWIELVKIINKEVFIYKNTENFECLLPKSPEMKSPFFIIFDDSFSLTSDLIDVRVSAIKQEFDFFEKNIANHLYSTDLAKLRIKSSTINSNTIKSINIKSSNNINVIVNGISIKSIDDRLLFDFSCA